MKIKIIPKKNVKYFYGYPTHVTVIGVRYGNKQNFMPCAWNIGLSYSPLIHGISVGNDRFTHKLLDKADCFTLNYFDFKYVSQIRKWGRSSGSQINKAKEFNIKWSNSDRIDAPTLDNAYVTFECLKLNKMLVGDHTLFTGRVILIKIDEKAVGGKSDTLNIKDINPVIYLGVDNYLTIDKHSQLSLKELPLHYI